MRVMDEDELDVAAQPPCPDCGTVMRDIAAGFECTGCGYIELSERSGGSSAGFDGPSIAGW